MEVVLRCHDNIFKDFIRITFERAGICMTSNKTELFQSNNKRVVVLI
jgi:hypothetical protein